MFFSIVNSFVRKKVYLLGILFRKVFLEIWQNSQENICARVSFLIKLKASGLRPATLFKTRLWHRCFPVNFTKFLGTVFLQNTYGLVLHAMNLAKFIKTMFFIQHFLWLLLSHAKSFGYLYKVSMVL